MFRFSQNWLLKSCSSSKDLSEYKISWSYSYWCKFYTQLKSVNVRHFGMVATTALKFWRPGHLQWHYLPTELNKNLPIVSEFGKVGTDTQDGITLAYIFPSGRKVG
jgi:hypothetical protein